MDEPIALTILRGQPTTTTTSSLGNPSSSATNDIHQEEPVESPLNSESSLLPRPVAKRPMLRPGGSRSAVFVSRNITKDASTALCPEQSSHTSGQPTNERAYRIYGRGGAGARPRKPLKGEEGIRIAIPELSSQIPCHDSPQQQQQQPVFRPMGRGGMGSHSRNVHSKSKSSSQKSQLVPDILLHRSKTEKKRRREGKEVDSGPRFDKARASELSFATISSIHFAGETDGPSSPPPPPQLDFFVQRLERKNEDDLSFISEDLEQDDEQKEKNPSTAAHRFGKLLRKLGDVPTAMLRQTLIMDDDQAPAPAIGMTNLITKRNHRQRSSFPVFPTTTTDTKTCDSERSSMSGLPLDERNRVGDDLSMSVGTSASFSSCTLRTGRTTAYYLGTESRPQTAPPSSSSDSSTALSPFGESSQLYDSESQAIRWHKTDCSSESSPSSFPESRVTELRTNPSPTTRPPEEWSGEWNARLSDVIQALRVLR